MVISKSSEMALTSKTAVLILVVTVFHRSGAQNNSTSELARTNFLLPKNCADPLLKNQPSGVHKIQPDPGLTKPFEVYCDQKFDKGGWTVFQNRFNGKLDFYRGRQQYEDGFGDLKKEFWLGLKKLNWLTYSDNFELAIVMSDWDGVTVTARYSMFKVTGAEEDYKLRTLGTYSGDAGDALTYSVGQKWTTMDKDVDMDKDNCAVTYAGAWWYKNCHEGNLNGLYVMGTIPDFATMMCWKPFRGYNYGLKTSRMMIRPVA